MKSKLDEKLAQMYEDHSLLMQKIAGILWEKGEDPQYYEKSTHCFLQEHAWEIMLPLPKNKWSKTFSELNKSYDQGMKWPNFTTYCYSSDVLFPPNINSSSLLFGYAIMENNTVVKTAFFEGIVLDGISFPKSVAIDPLAELHGIKPKYYIGVSVEKEDLERFRFKKDVRVLEGYVERKNKEANKTRLYDSYIAAYHLQMAYAPNYLPRRLQEFARKNRLPFPEDQRASV